MVRFQLLWNSHPNVRGDKPLLDKKMYENQCAVNLYAALQGAGVNLKSFHGQLSWQKDRPRYALRAQELADWLASPSSRIPAVQKHAANDVFDKLREKRGIIFFQNYWGAGRQGDHIDLWNGSRLTAMDTWVRIHLRIGNVGMHTLGFGSDFEHAESVWFWPLS